MADSELLYPCSACRAIYEVVRHHVRPPADPHCEVCQQELPMADGDDWLIYRRVASRP